MNLQVTLSRQASCQGGAWEPDEWTATQASKRGKEGER